MYSIYSSVSGDLIFRDPAVPTIQLCPVSPLFSLARLRLLGASKCILPVLDHGGKDRKERRRVHLQTRDMLKVNHNETIRYERLKLFFMFFSHFSILIHAYNRIVIGYKLVAVFFICKTYARI